MSAKELKDKLKSYRTELTKPITKMTPEEMQKEIAYHEAARKQQAAKTKRAETLAKSPPHISPERKKTAKTVEIYSDASSTDNDDYDGDTIKSRIQKKY